MAVESDRTATPDVGGTSAPDVDLVARAAAAVEAFRDGTGNGPLPEDADGWNDAYVRAIRDLKERYRGSPDLGRLLKIASEQLYGKDVHWALELLQNAEDAGAKHIAFVFEKDRVLVSNDGDLFTAEDVWAICSAGHSAKKNKIGFFGIGFKSVFKLSDAPEIRSGRYALRLEDKIYPSPLDVDDRVRPRGARFTLPVRPAEQDRLASMLNDLTSPDFLHLLLTLNSLETIRVFDRTGAGHSGRFRRRVTGHGPHGAWDECEIVGTWAGCEAQTWRRHRSWTNEIPHGITREGREFTEGEKSAVVLARPTKGSPPVPTNLHCFLPLDVPSELRWLVQADFDPTPGRERLRENAWNRWLMDQIGACLARAVLSEARSGEAPWPWIPLSDDIRSPLQQLAYEREMSALSELAFIRTSRGWRSPAGATWGSHAELPEIVREADLLATTGRDDSYVASSVLGVPASPDRNRAEQVLVQLGSTPVELGDVIALLWLDDRSFYSQRRDGRWWLAALDLIARHADESQRRELSRTRCLPVQGIKGESYRVAPSPAISTEGYLVAFSRADNLEDLQAFFGASQIYLIDSHLTAPRARQREADDAAQAARRRVRGLLEDDRFGVAPEAGPYHVINHLVLPRMRALAAADHLSQAQVDQLWRLFEYSRQKWPSYVVGYHRSRSDKEDSELAVAMGDLLMVVASETHGRAVRRRAVAANRTYLSSTDIGHDGMEVALAGLPGIPVVDPIHSRVVSVRTRRRGGRRIGRVMPAGEFIRHLGAAVGPRIERNPGWNAYTNTVHKMSPQEAYWIEWSSVPAARGRVGLENDWISPDLERLAERWPSLGRRNRQRRARALWQSIEADWHRLGEAGSAQPVSLYYQWNALGDRAAASWVAILRRLEWVRAASGELVAPPGLVVDTKLNRLGVASNEDALLGWSAPPLAMADALGIADQPSVDALLATLGQLRVLSEQSEPSQLLAAARACYDLLAQAIRNANSPDERVRLTERLRPQFQGNSQVGLVYAPPPTGFSGKSWWPSSRVVQGDFGSVAGPYVGQLAGRYPRATALWDALGLEKHLSPRLVLDLIERELVNEPDDLRARDYYGRLVAHLESLGQAALGERPEVPALSSNGWMPSSEVWWTSRPEVESGLGLLMNWWQPGSLDPSTLRVVADWLGIRELRSTAEGGSLKERWEVGEPESPEVTMENPWQRAVLLWPDVLRAEAPGSDDGLLGRLAAELAELKPRLATHIRGHLRVIGPNGVEVRASIEPSVLLRRSRSEIIARDSEDLFSRQAADTLATLVPARRLQAANTLAGLLSDALHSPDALARQTAKYSGARQPDASFVFEPPPEDEDATLEVGELVRDLKAGKAPATTRREERQRQSELPPQPLASPAVFELASVEYMSKAAEPAEPRIALQKLRAPVKEDDGQRSDMDVPFEPPTPAPRFSNIDIEEAARWFVAEFERSQGRTVTRQGDLVGADFVASDGRYIEVKAFSGTSEGFDLEPAEWRAARRPDVGLQYWVYVVEHLRDGQAPVVSAIFNPVLDASVMKEPTGKLRVRRWRSAATVATGTFQERADIGGDVDLQLAGDYQPNDVDRRRPG